MIGSECLSCLDEQEAANNAGDDQNNNQNQQGDGNFVIESCEEIYAAAGKCEQEIEYGVVADPNNNACNYMDGVKILRQDGVIHYANNPKSGVASFMIAFFAFACAGLGFYVYKLRQKLSVKKLSLIHI